MYSFYCPCGFASNDYDDIAAHSLARVPLVEGSCCNCSGRKCMDCVLRYMHDECEDSCPDCCHASSSAS